MDKDLATRLLTAVENLYIENLILKTMLGRSVPGWKRAFDQIVANPDPQALAQLRSQFDPVRKRLAEDQSLEQVIQEFLKVVPPTKDAN